MESLSLVTASEPDMLVGIVLPLLAVEAMEPKGIVSPLSPLAIRFQA